MGSPVPSLGRRQRLATALWVEVGVWSASGVIHRSSCMGHEKS